MLDPRVVRPIVSRPHRAAGRQPDGAGSDEKPANPLLVLAARSIAVALLFVWLVPLSLPLTGCATTLALLVTAIAPDAKRQIGAKEALNLVPGSRLALLMRDSSRVSGRYLGRSVLAPERYAPRFEAWDSTHAYTPLALGESLHVELVDGQKLHDRFRGYAVRALLFRPDDGPLYRRISYESTRTIVRANGQMLSPDSLLAADIERRLPLAEALAIEEGAPVGSMEDRKRRALQVPFEDVIGASALSRNGALSGLVVLGAVTDVVLLVVMIRRLEEASHQTPQGCQSAPSAGFSLSGQELPWTDRPFDLVLARFVDVDPVSSALPRDTSWTPASRSESRPAAGPAERPSPAAGSGR